MKIPYKESPNAKGEVCQYAALNVHIALAKDHAPRSKRFEAIIDSGATRTTFHASIGEAIGLDIDKGELEEPMSITGKKGKTYIHEIDLYLPGGVVRTRVAFSQELPVAGLLGMMGFFEHFKITFDPTGRHVELERVHQG